MVYLLLHIFLLSNHRSKGENQMLIPIIIILLVIAPPALAAPAITGYSGTIGDGQSVTISGSGFGANSYAGTTAIEFLGGASGPIESGTLGQTFTRSRWSVDKGWGDDLIWSNSNVPWGTKTLYMEGVSSWPEAPLYYNFPSSVGTNGDRLFVSWWERVNYTGNGQYKLIRFSPTQTIQDGNGQLTWFFHTSSGNYFQRPTVGDQNQYPNFCPANTQNTWQRVDIDILTSSSSSGTLNVTGYRSGTAVNSTTFNNFYTSPGSAWQYVVWQNYFGTGGTGSMTDGNIWFKDIYVSHGTRARVEVCNSSTWSARQTCMIQPASAWSASSATIRVNRGAFGAASTAYLYLIDSTGAVNSTGFAVTFGGIGGPAPLVPFPPTINSIN